MRSDELWFGLTATNNRSIALEQLHKTTYFLWMSHDPDIVEVFTPKTQLVYSKGFV